MNLKEKINSDIKQSMIDKNNHKRDLLKFLKSEIQKIEKDENKLLNDNDIIKIINKTIKNLKLMNRESERKEIEILEKYLPKPLSKNELITLCKDALKSYPDKVNNYKLGKTGLIGLFMGEVMKKSDGLADPKETNIILKEILDN